MEVLKDLRSVHFPVNLPDIPSMAMAARARVARFENSAQGGLRVRRRTRALQRLVQLPANQARAAKFNDFVQDCFLFQLQAATGALTTAEKASRSTPSLLDSASPASLQKEGWQAKATRILRAAARHSAAAHVRRRLDRWQLPTLPGHRPVAWSHTLSLSAPLLPPRVQACQIRTAWNGWCTARRYQQNRGCLFNCSRGEDSIEHYAFCSEFHSLCRRHLGLTKPPAEFCLGDFLGTLPYVNSLPSHCRSATATADAAALRAIGVYALFKVHNAWRYGLPSDDCPAALRGYIRAAVVGHTRSQRLVQLAFKRPRSNN